MQCLWVGGSCGQLCVFAPGTPVVCTSVAVGRVVGAACSEGVQAQPMLYVGCRGGGEWLLAALCINDTVRETDMAGGAFSAAFRHLPGHVQQMPQGCCQTVAFAALLCTSRPNLSEEVWAGE